MNIIVIIKFMRISFEVSLQQSCLVDGGLKWSMGQEVNCYDITLNILEHIYLVYAQCVLSDHMLDIGDTIIDQQISTATV